MPDTLIVTAPNHRDLLISVDCQRLGYPKIINLVDTLDRDAKDIYVKKAYYKYDSLNNPIRIFDTVAVIYRERGMP